MVWLGCGSAGCVTPEGPRPGPSRGMVVVSLAHSPKAICTEFLEYRNHSRSSSTNNANHVADENYDFQFQPSKQLNPRPRTRFKKTWHEKFFKVVGPATYVGEAARLPSTALTDRQAKKRQVQASKNGQKKQKRPKAPRAKKLGNARLLSSWPCYQL